MATPDTKHSIVIYKQGPYRGGDKRWSNRYHFEGALPTDDSEWEALADAIVLDEKTCLIAAETIVEAVGYDAGSATSTNPHGDAVWVKSYTTAGTFSPGVGDVGCPGDCATMVRYGTDARSAKNHPVYLFNYYHGAQRESSDADTVAADLVTAFEDYADAWLTGYTVDGSARQRCGPRGAVATSRKVDAYVRHRDFPS